MRKRIFIILAVITISIGTSLSVSATATLDSCNMNDICETAIHIPDVFSDAPFVCISACNTGATPELFNNACGIGTTPTTWFSVYSDGNASLMNIYVSSDDFVAPTITLFQQVENCANLQPIGLTTSNLSCMLGSNGEAEAIGTEIGANEIYVIAVGSATGQTGDFELCVNTISFGSTCVVDRNIEIVSRSFGGPLAGPFEPGETVGICFNVNSYTAAGNGCQWFQGLIPVFGNGWDPSSFDANGQPLNTTLNGIGIPGNGIYGTSTWDWFSDVDYHHDDIFLQGGDFDGNGSYDLCHLLYEADCPNTGGFAGGCCNPCWGSPLGTILPAGWFAYGINGSCGTPGPPVRVDWGDGNTCGGGMGPWSFCFALTVREYPECLEDPTTLDLSLGFFTLADGQTGAWTGSASVCALDQPAKITLPMHCSEETVINAGTDTLTSLCTGDSLLYQIYYPGVLNWTWTITPTGYVQQPSTAGENEYLIKQVVINPTLTPKSIFYSFTGYFADPSITVVKTMWFTIYPQIHFSLPDVTVCERDSSLLLSPSITGGTSNYNYNWTPTGETTPAIVLNNPFPSTVGLVVSDEVGCEHSDIMHIKTRPCHLIGTDPPLDDDNEPDHPKDPPPPDGNIHEPENNIHARGTITATELFTIMPVPARERIIISLQQPSTPDGFIVIFDVNGHAVLHLDSRAITGMKKSVDISQLQEGVYYITLFTSRCNATQRMVKM